jgi:ArsR family transcriptional regulator
LSADTSIDEAAQVLRTLADPTRLRLLRLLLGMEDGKALCVKALAARLGVSQPAVSQHLRILRHLGLVAPERRGYRVHYVLNRGRLSGYWEQLEQVLGLDHEG